MERVTGAVSFAELEKDGEGVSDARPLALAELEADSETVRVTAGATVAVTSDDADGETEGLLEMRADADGEFVAFGDNEARGDGVDEAERDGEDEEERDWRGDRDGDGDFEEMLEPV
jgi:hypothetical protein